MVKNYIIDTNILIQTHGEILSGLDDNNVLIVDVTLEELDKLKSEATETGFAARECVRRMPDFRNGADSVEIGNGGALRILQADGYERYLPAAYDRKRNDNKIIGAALRFYSAHEDTWLITNDKLMSIKASIAGLRVQDYHNDRSSGAYAGRRNVYIPYEAYEEIVLMSNYGEGVSPAVLQKHSVEPFVENEFLEIYIDGIGDKSPAMVCWYRHENCFPIDCGSEYNVYGIAPRNIGQRLALKALSAPWEEIPLVILKGPAGCGKTLLAEAAAMRGFFGKRRSVYDKIVISRSNTLSDNDMGYLPGDIRDKMDPLLAPFYDNFRVLLKENGASAKDASIQIDDLMLSGSIEIQPLAYIRGRSIPNAYIIIDEAQNLTISQAKTIVTRAGEGSKIVLLGDPGQIDNPKLNMHNCGISYVSDRMQGSPNCCQLEFRAEECRRSAIASDAIRRL